MELMPLRMHESKSDQIWKQQRGTASKFQQAGLLSQKVLETVEPHE
jgi:hypothetical protein